MIPKIPYIVAGDLAYGGKLHNLLAGSIFGGKTVLQGYCLVNCNNVKLLSRNNCIGSIDAELYYIEPDIITLIDKYFSGLATVKRTVTIEHDDVVINAEVHEALDYCETVRDTGNWIRLLLVLPPLLPPPTSPLSTYLAELFNYKPCNNKTAYCKAIGATSEAIVADIYINKIVLREWLKANNLALIEGIAYFKIHGMREIVLLVHVPVKPF
ncbi:hypothetical protein PYJP_14140 [Pyrofollis japonicus]|uniref:hypothetical protein n=1 Tax=Pyrofollis japonicus TaxID=3060460 RepID=UPI00295A61F9|nr:hypothetical protein [Pyrofollis japonicus]BEP18062.1 hypothetical protein PYJP_14140 [Pyrofollis japonicus]